MPYPTEVLWHTIPQHIHNTIDINMLQITDIWAVTHSRLLSTSLSPWMRIKQKCTSVCQLENNIVRLTLDSNFKGNSSQDFTGGASNKIWQPHKVQKDKCLSRSGESTSWGNPSMRGNFKLFKRTLGSIYMSVNFKL